MSDIVNPLCKIVALVVATLAKPTAMEGYGEQGVYAIEEICFGKFIGNGFRHIPGNVRLPVVFEGMDDAAHFFAVIAQSTCGTLYRYAPPKQTLNASMLFTSFI